MLLIVRLNLDNFAWYYNCKLEFAMKFMTFDQLIRLRFS